ncbi:hypothetical protein ACWCYY_16345 [Kitasatospora sp. NPDC001664]
MRRILGAVAAVGLALVGVAGTTVPAEAAGGGCNSYGRTWRIAVCSSDNGVRVSADVYLNSQGTSGSCYLSYKIWDETDLSWLQSSGSQPCYLGRHPEIHTPKEPKHKYHTYAEVVVDGTPVSLGVSPTTS